MGMAGSGRHGWGWWVMGKGPRGKFGEWWNWLAMVRNAGRGMPGTGGIVRKVFETGEREKGGEEGEGLVMAELCRAPNT